jgi:NhaP-type Na+/H+ or K+/H+ antiporter
MSITEGVIFVTVVSGCVCVYALVAKKTVKWDVSPAMIFITLGIIAECITRYGFKLTDTLFPREGILPLAEIALSMTLFHDISTVQFSSLQTSLPARTLCIGLPLCILLTYFFIRGMLPGVGIGGALFLAGTLSPTDAALSTPVILNPGVPSLVRQSLNVESGMNDGIATPIVFIGLAIMREGSLHLSQHVKLFEIGLPIVYSVVIAVIVGHIYAYAMDTADKYHLCDKEGEE